MALFARLLSKPTVGLDIGSRYVKAVQLKNVGKKIHLEKFGISEIYPSGDKPHEPEEQRVAVVDAVRRVCSEAGITAKHAVTAVAGESVLVRYIQLPPMPEDALKDSLQWAAEEYIPYQIEDVNIDSAIIGYSGEGDARRMNVLLVCARKDLIQEHVNLVREAGLVPVVIDVDSFAFLNCYDVNYSSQDPQEVVGLANIGGDITNISVFSNGLPHFSRDISIGGSTITSAIQQRLGISGAEAEELKFKRGAPKAEAGADAAAAMGMGMGDTTAHMETPGADLEDSIRSTVEAMTGGVEEDPSSNEAMADRAIRGTLNNLVGEIRRSIQFYENQAQGTRVGKIVLGGGSVQLSGLTEFVQGAIGLPVETIDPLARIPVTGTEIDADSLRHSKHMLSVGIGLALRKAVD